MHAVGSRVGSRLSERMTDFSQCLLKENMKIIHREVTQLTSNGCKSDDGNEHEFDVIICATGFNTSFRPRFPIFDPGNINLQDSWAEEPQSYMGIAAPSFPNFFMFLGPHSLVANRPLIPGSEAQADHMLKLIDRSQSERIRSFSPKTAAVEDFITHTDTFMKATVWSQECRSGWKNNTTTGRVTALWPGSTLHCLEALRDLQADDWDIIYEGNRFAWLGNGFSQADFDPTCDLAYYIRDHDDSEFASRGKRRKTMTRSGTQPPRELFTLMESKLD